jgi:trk system potassium uptake protein TrkH
MSVAPGPARRRRLPPPAWVALSFVGLILVGAVALRLPWATPASQPIGWVDALFTSTSAACVTGLSVRDTGTGFTAAGQATILLLVQVGGLGVMTFSLFYLIIGARASVEQRELVEQTLTGGAAQSPRRLLRTVFLFTIASEAAGAILLWLALRGRVPDAAWQALFHSISAFCNAGFSLFSDSLVAFRGDPRVNAVVAVLIVLGGLGFLVVEDLARRRFRWRLLALHTKVVVTVSALLLAIGALAFWALERERSLAGLPASEQALASLFQSVTARTAGFHTVDFGALAPATLLGVIILMFIGGSPGSCAGGIKTTSAAILGLALRAELAGRKYVNVFGRTLPRATVAAAFAVTTSALAAANAGLFALLVVEGPSNGDAGGARFVDYAFEAMSALGTVGLSTGVTPTLAPLSKLVLVALMFLGRVGPLTLAAVVAGRRADDWRHPTEAVMIG